MVQAVRGRDRGTHSDGEIDGADCGDELNSPEAAPTRAVCRRRPEQSRHLQFPASERARAGGFRVPIDSESQTECCCGPRSATEGRRWSTSTKDGEILPPCRGPQDMCRRRR